MEDLTILIPVHEYNDTVKTLLDKAIGSVPTDLNILISCSSESYPFIMENYNKYTVIDCGDNKKFTHLVNQGVENITTKWFSILEFDDVYTDITFETFERYLKFKPETSVFLPFTDLMDYENNKFIGYGNEAVWASSFSTELGYVDNDCLSNYFDFYLTGSFFNTDDWKEYGGLKESIELTFWYEFLLRMTYNGKKIYVIPRVMYVHNLNREGSLIKYYSETMNEKTSSKYIDLAKQEQFFKKDRNKTISFDDKED